MKPYRRASPLLLTPVQYWQGRLMMFSYHALVPTSCLLFITAPICLVLALGGRYLSPLYASHLMLLARWVWLPTTVGVFLCLGVPLLVILTDKPITRLGLLICRWRTRRHQH